jgi:hypothetical protein
MPGERPVKVTMATLSLSCRKHGVCVDSRGALYVAEVSYTVRGSHENPPREPRSFQKFIRNVLAIRLPRCPFRKSFASALSG